MKLSDFSTIVQLGVGLHAGAAFFQAISETASNPLSKRLWRLKGICDEKKLREPVYEELADKVSDLIGNFEVQSVRLYPSYVLLLNLNGFVAVALIVVLIWITIDQNRCVAFLGAFTIIVVSVAPVLGSLSYFYYLWRSELHGISKSAAFLHRQIVDKN